MTKFKVGNLIRAIELDGLTGRYLLPNKIYRVATIGEINSKQGHLITLDGLYEKNGEPVRAYDRRFELYLETSYDAVTEYEEVMEFDRLVNG